MVRGEEDDLAFDPPSDNRGRPLAAVASALLFGLGLFLTALIVWPGEFHEGEGRQALQSHIPLLINGLLAGAAFAGAGLALGAAWRRKTPSSAGLQATDRDGDGEETPAARETGFRSTFASAPDGMALLDGERILSANPALETLVGVRSGGLDGQDLSQLFAAPGEAEADGDEHANANGESGAETRFSGSQAEAVPAFETALRRRDGETLRVEAGAFPFPWQGRTLRLLAIRDIRDRKVREETLLRSENALRKSEESLRALIAQSPVAFFAFDAEGAFSLAEGDALEAMGLKGSDLEGQSIFAKPARLRPLQPAIRRALDGESVDETLEAAGSIFEVRLRPLGGAGRKEGAMGIAMDVTELRRTEEELRRSKEHLRTVVANAPLILFALDRKGVYTLCEGRGLEAMGMKPGENQGKSAFDLHRDVPALALNVKRALSGEEFASTVQIGTLWFETYYSPVFEGYGEVAGVVGVAINVTDRKRAEDALRRSEDQLRHSRKMEAIGRVAGGVAHDFNNLLTAITGYTELLLTGEGGAKAHVPAAEDRKSLVEIRKAAERATTLTRQLLAFSRRQVLTPKVMNLNRTVSDIDSMIRRVIREDIELVAILDPHLGDVWVDPGQIEQVILNLALNARDAMPKGGQLTLETANVELEGPIARGELFLVPGPYVMLAVSDTGMGMDEEVKAHLFEPFFTTKGESGEGAALGLGLSAVYGIVKQSGGTIVVETERGRGTTFKVYLPRADKGAAARRGGKPLQSLHGEETVLLVEDEEAVRTLIREILVMHGYKVLEARSGGEAILVSQRIDGPIHMLLTDVVMANMSGRELADHLRPLRPEMKILFISGYSEDAVLGEAGGIRGPLTGGGPGGRGDASFLAKPFTPKTLAMKVREVLEGKPAERQGLARLV